MTGLTISRRRLLAGLSGASVGLAGCSARYSSSNAEPFDSVGVENTILFVTLTDQASLTQVHVIAPEGTEYESEDVVDGQTRLEIPVGPTYEPGEYRLVGDPRGETSIVIQPDLRIREFGAGANNPDRMPSALGTATDDGALVVIENSWSGPTAIRTLAFGGDVPNPTESGGDGESGIFDPDRGRWNADQVVLDAEAQLTLFSSSLPSSFAGQETTCSSMPETGTVTVRVEHSARDEPTTASFQVTYNEASSGDCDITIGKQVS